MLLTTIKSALVGAALTAVGPGDSSASEPSAKRFDLLGVQVCVGDPGDAQPCHVRLFPPAQEQARADEVATEPVPIQVSAFGKNLCFGCVPEHAVCDVRFGTTAEQNTAGA